MPNFDENTRGFKMSGFSPYTKTIAKEQMFTDMQDKKTPSIPKKSTQMKEANSEEISIIKKLDAVNAKMKGMDKNSSEYKKLMQESRRLDNQLPAFD
tara:strand:- start:5665 stop:5955 length:291 start_codon:yes stop_codon:yes gene_type:complete